MEQRACQQPVTVHSLKESRERLVRWKRFPGVEDIRMFSDDLFFLQNYKVMDNIGQVMRGGI